LRDHSWFIAFAPADQPRIALAVIVENGGWGASAAAPIARKVLDAYLLGADGKLKPPEPVNPALPAPRQAIPDAPVPEQKRATNTNPAARSEGRLMIYEEVTTGSRTRRTLTGAARVLFALKLDGPLIIALALVAVYGLIILYSASGQSTITIYRTLGRLALGTAAMLVLAQVNPNFLRRTSPWLYAFGMLLLFIVYGVGHIGKGAQRWLDLGIIRFQPSELMKLAVPMTVAWFCMSDRCRRVIQPSCC